ncbi:13146_t:CDS:1, partial [Dentiscutata heterogama]
NLKVFAIQMIKYLLEKKFERKLKRLTDLTNKKKVVVVKKKTNYEIGHDFEKIIVKLLNNNGFVAQLVVFQPGDFGSNIFTSYKKNLIIIQYKNQMSK